ncbi:MAG: transcriptional regulator [Syntrophomonadaceae bacterium]|jgi:hypothetical protein
MTFAEKLDLLMKITNTSNSLLARNISMDASFISRLRRGIRTPAKNVNYIKSMAEYFARNCRAEYQKTALQEAILSTSEIQLAGEETITEALYRWLGEKDQEEYQMIEGFFDDFSHFQFKKIGQIAADDVNIINSKPLPEVNVYYGVEGKQTAVLTFLSLVLQSPKPQTLLLFSDEDLGWLIDNREFTAKWAALLLQVIKNGNTIKIIHNINRNLDEMLAAIREWLPIYMTGAIQPYYYPKTRDGLFRRTLFIAPDTAAVTSSSTGNAFQNAANLLFTTKRPVQALIQEYNDILNMCRPLMRIITPFNNNTDYFKILAEFEEEEGNAIIKTSCLANISIPGDVTQSILSRIQGPAGDQLLSYQQNRINNFYHNLKKNSLTEIFTLPELEEILAGRIMVNFSDIINETQLWYTPNEYCKHLKNIIYLLKTYDNYHVHLTSNEALEGSMVYVKENVGVLVGKTSLPSTIFAINEGNMTAAFWDYMNVILRKETKGKVNRKHTSSKLEALVSRLETRIQD